MTQETKTKLADIVERGRLHRRAWAQKLITMETLSSIAEDLMTELQQAIAEDEETSPQEFHRIFNRIEKHSSDMSRTFKLFGKFIGE